MHTGPVIDLYLGADIGAWVLEQVDPAVVRGVFTLDPTIGERAVALGIDVEGEPQGRVALSVHYARVLRPDELARYTAAYNLHPSYLPWGRGWWAVFWAIYADEPAGASLHRMTAQVDAGPLVDQRRVEVLPNDTGGSLLVRIRQAERDLFQAWWPRLLSADPIPEQPQPPGGSKHSRAEVDALRSSESPVVQRALNFG